MNPVAQSLFGRFFLAAGLGVFLTLSACERPECDIAWQPTVRAPVFYGHQDWGAGAAPGALRIWYPSLEGSPMDAPLLHNCGRYPLIVLLHGHCSESQHYKKWFLLPAQLARSGYIVVVPELPFTTGGGYPWSEAHPDLILLTHILDWAFNEWPDRAAILPGPIGIVGHSYGALLGARLAIEVDTAAYASIGGVWAEWPSSPANPLGSTSGVAAIPKLFAWGSDDTFAVMGALFDGLTTPKHRVVIQGATHWDYLQPVSTNCSTFSGPCNLTGALTADFATSFFSKYLPPEDWAVLSALIPNSLVPPAADLTPDQMFFAGGHLPGFNQIGFSQNCSVTQTWFQPGNVTGSITLP